MLYGPLKASSASLRAVFVLPLVISTRAWSSSRRPCAVGEAAGGIEASSLPPGDVTLAVPGADVASAVAAGFGTGFGGSAVATGSGTGFGTGFGGSAVATGSGAGFGGSAVATGSLTCGCRRLNRESIGWVSSAK